MGITVAVFATLSLIALIAVGMVKGPESAGTPAPANTQQYISQQRDRPLTSLDFIQSSQASEQAESQYDDYPRSGDGVTLPQQFDR